MGYEEEYQSWKRYLGRHGGNVRAAVGRARKLFASHDTRDAEWLETALQDTDRKWFVAAVLAGSVPRRFLEPMIRAAVYEPNPSFNRQFVEPCGKQFGRGVVIDFLTRYLRYGTDLEKHGAANALYWADTLPNPEERPVPHDAFLQVFVRNDDLDVRRALVTWNSPAAAGTLQRGRPAIADRGRPHRHQPR